MKGGLKGAPFPCSSAFKRWSSPLVHMRISFRICKPGFKAKFALRRWHSYKSLVQLFHDPIRKNFSTGCGKTRCVTACGVTWWEKNFERNGGAVLERDEQVEKCKHAFFSRPWTKGFERSRKRSWWTLCGAFSTGPSPLMRSGGSGGWSRGLGEASQRYWSISDCFRVACKPFNQRSNGRDQ